MAPDPDPTLLPSVRPPPPPDGPAPWTDGWTIVATLLALAGIAVAAWVVVRRLRPAPPVPAPVAPPPATGFEAAAEEGGRALRSTSPPERRA